MKRFVMTMVAMLAVGVIFAGPAFAAGYPAGNPTVGHNGRTITGDTWCPGSTVTIFVDGVEAGTAKVDGSGHFSFPLPPEVGAGTHHVTVKGLASDCATQEPATLTLVLGASGTSSGGVAFTGADVKVGSLALMLLLIAGTVALVAGRRSRSAAK
jgi:hypothetical protein